MPAHTARPAQLRGSNDLTLKRAFVPGQVPHFVTLRSWPVAPGEIRGKSKGDVRNVRWIGSKGDFTRLICAVKIRMYERPLSLASHAPLMCSVIFRTSVSIVLRHRFGLYGRTRIRLSTSKIGPVPSALIRQTGLFWHRDTNAQFEKNTWIVIG